jgi:hypothetical protein
MTNLHRRAQRHGGTFDAGPRKPTGTVLTCRSRTTEP